VKSPVPPEAAKSPAQLRSSACPATSSASQLLSHSDPLLLRCGSPLPLRCLGALPLELRNSPGSRLTRLRSSRVGSFVALSPPAPSASAPLCSSAPQPPRVSVVHCLNTAEPGLAIPLARELVCSQLALRFQAEKFPLSSLAPTQAREQARTMPQPQEPRGAQN